MVAHRFTCVSLINHKPIFLNLLTSYISSFIDYLYIEHLFLYWDVHHFPVNYKKVCFRDSKFYVLYFINIFLIGMLFATNSKGIFVFCLCNKV